MLGADDGSALRRPLGYAIAGGLFVNRALTLLTAPGAALLTDAHGSSE
jgi:multidrug efflux pump subunit AcrB